MRRLLDRLTTSLLTLWVHRRGALFVLAALLLSALALLTADDALARVGGGQNFSTGGGGGGGGGGFSGGGGGGGGGDGEFLVLLIYLLIEYPQIGVPVLIVVVIVFVVRAFISKAGNRYVSRTHHDHDWEPEPAGGRGPVPGLAGLRTDDHGFSMPVFLDFVQLLHRRATEAAVTREWAALEPFVSPGVREDLQGAHRGLTEVRDVVAGGITVLSFERGAEVWKAQVVIQDTRLETLDGGGTRHVYVEEAWTLARKQGVTSKAPEDVVRMGCPSCGAAIDTDRSGHCRVCGTPIVDGLLQWRAIGAVVRTRRAVKPPTVGWTSGGAEPSYHVPSAVDPDLGTTWRTFRGRHPGFDAAAFERRVEGIYLELQRAWSAGDWDKARPYVTDTLYQTLRFYLEQYTEHGLMNRLGDVQLQRQQVVKVQLDAWYESVTVRIWGSMKDWVEDREGNVVGGNKNADRHFSEYWTFLRAIGSGDETGEVGHCPSCGAPLDKVSQAGICGYCDSKITTGKFDWVLSRIDQPEVYRG